MVISVSNKGKGKVFTYGFKDIGVSLEELAEVANKNAISGPGFKDGHRSSASIIRPSNVVLIDCDKEGQAIVVESKLSHYDYVKVPSASNSPVKPYKWHFFVPTQEPMSIYSTAFKWQVEQFFGQVGITDDMIDTTGSFDIARQFAPANIGMSTDYADERSSVHDVDLQIPVASAPDELCNPAAKSVTARINGITAAELPSEHLWFQSKAIHYHIAIKAVTEADETKESEEEKIIVSGFGCPHDNHLHTGDRTRGYGFAFLGKDGNIVVKCTGNECKEHPYFEIPNITEVEVEMVEV